ncbi:hypothetical protein TMFC_50131 [Tenacibaculum maritimum]|uniref:hypothetical protein n=1 Tax=Tenacibaculum maritimum TaxID=107401 RepID=UPI0012E5A3D6|nr:hypothetical protein [Tenacibaculum maritimum]CAA0242302.1 hypothetical protein TMFC_50131 [Tenacibaculum maritimum]
MKSYFNPKTKKQMVVYHCECGMEEFKTKYSELCENCELKPKIKEGIENQIIAEAKIKQSILTSEQFATYINNEINNASEAITERLLLQRQQETIDPKNDCVGSRIMGVIWNSERIKALNNFLETNNKLQEKTLIEVENLKEKQEASNKEENPHPRFFTSLRGFKIFERFKGTIQNPLADYSFIYRMMLKDNLIYESIGDSEYRRWLSSEYHIEIDKTKQLGRCSTPPKEQLYSSIKSDIK